DLSQRMQYREYLLEIRLRCSNPAISKVFEDNAGNAQLSGPALHDERLAGADTAGDEITHRKRVQQSAPQQLGILAKPGLDGLVTRNVIQSERRFQKFQKLLTLAFDLLLFHPHEPDRCDRLIVIQNGESPSCPNTAEAGQSPR